jgi:CheY-like chemotaxis protein
VPVAPARSFQCAEAVRRSVLEEVQPPVTTEAAERAAPQSAAGLSCKKVLVVDDDIRNVFALTSALETHGMEVLHAESGKEGIDLLKRSGDIDVVLMDVMMPGLDGIDTMRIVRQLDGYRELPIIAVTAKAMMGDREKCLQAGATDYVAKPVNMDVLLATLWRSVGQKAVEKAMPGNGAVNGKSPLPLRAVHVVPPAQRGHA